MKNVLSVILLFGNFVVGWGSIFIEDQVQIANPTDIVEVNNRIVGGETTTIERYPFTVQIIQSNNHLICGGTLITRQNVLTAAHCLFDILDNQLITTRDLKVRAGTTKNNSGGTTESVSRYTLHEQYTNSLRHNDIAIMRTSSRFTLSDSIDLASLPVQNFEVTEDMSLVHVGWGWTTVGLPWQQSPDLRHVTVYKISRGVCNSRYGISAYYNITDKMLCTGLINEGGAGHCMGDMGGPLLYGRFVIGVSSWGLSCSQAHYPSVSTRVSNFTSWIDFTVNEINGSPSVSESRIILIFTLICTMLHWHSN